MRGIDSCCHSADLAPLSGSDSDVQLVNAPVASDAVSHLEAVAEEQRRGWPVTAWGGGKQCLRTVHMFIPLEIVAEEQNTDKQFGEEGDSA